MSGRTQTLILRKDSKRGFECPVDVSSLDVFPIVYTEIGEKVVVLVIVVDENLLEKTTFFGDSSLIVVYRNQNYNYVVKRGESRTTRRQIRVVPSVSF